MAVEYAITPLVIAWGLQREMSRFTYLNNYGVKFDIPYLAFLVQGPNLNLLVDTACSADDYQRWIKPADRPLIAAGETFKDVVDADPIERVLAKHSLTLDDIHVVFQTHLHWDHCLNTIKFPRSRVLFQRAELEDLPCHPFYRFTFAPDEFYDNLQRSLALEVLDGNSTIADGLDVIFTPGHTAGGQSLAVRTSQGRFVIAGLCTINKNYHLTDQEQQRLGYPIIPPGSHKDVVRSYESCLRLKEIGGANILPLHEPSLAQRGTIK